MEGVANWGGTEWIEADVRSCWSLMTRGLGFPLMGFFKLKDKNALLFCVLFSSFQVKRKDSFHKVIIISIQFYIKQTNKNKKKIEMMMILMKSFD